MVTLGETASKVFMQSCPKRIEILGHPVFELQHDGSYINDLANRIVQNDEDQAWFISGLNNKGTDPKALYAIYDISHSTIRPLNDLNIARKGFSFRSMDLNAQI